MTGIDSILYWFLGGVFIGLFVCLAFILKYKSRENRFQEKLEYLEDVLTSAPDGFICQVMTSGKAVYFCSRRLRVFLSLADENVDFGRVIGQLDKSSQKALAKAIDTLQKKKQGFQISVGTDFGFAHFDVKGDVLMSGKDEAFILWFKNMSDPAAAQQVLRHKLDDALSRTGQLETVLNTLHMPIFLTNAMGDVLFKNMSYQKLEALEETSALRWKKMIVPDLINESLVLHYAQDTTTEEILSARLEDMTKTNQQVLRELSAGVSIFDAHGKLIFYNKKFGELWHLESHWLKKEPMFESYLNKLQEKGFLPQVKDFAAYKKEQKDRFATLVRATEELVYLPDGRIVRRLMVPYSEGSVLFVDEVK